MAAAHARRLATGDSPAATPAVGTASGGRSQFNLSSSAATAVVFVSILLCFILLCTYCRCARQRAIADARRRVMRGVRERVPSVLLLRPPAGVDALPVLPYSAAAAAGAKKGQRVEDCPVCLEAFADDDGVKVVPVCGHVFHGPCIDQWLAVRNSCPVCRCAVVCYYADRARDTAVLVDDDDGDDQDIVLGRVVAMIGAIRLQQREEEEEAGAAAARRAPASGGGGDGG
ncbi:RING-H2 finger protein ATL5-like [Oryza brachyantha]|uniref:RING-H2 finger protein ATL5-like n=1 Tax=Oryza brachyantha TaxID=4533 RepID=UPI001ADBFFAC|nr:RING-H2 finger protein ATL5-like [Oryza brachyantha]